MSGEVGYRVARGVALLTLSQPAKFNAMTLAMWRAIPVLAARAAADASVRVVLVQGEGQRAFCAGADISQFGSARTGADAAIAYDRDVGLAYAALTECPKPVVAAIAGICFGGGLGLAMACDIRLARADARFRIPAARLGLGYAYANVAMLERRVGLAAASDILFSARVVDAAEALRMAIVGAVFSADDFDAGVTDYVAAIAENAPLSLIAAKRALIEVQKPDALRDVAGANAAVAACFDSADYAEGQRAFAAKRKPAFVGS